MICRTKCQMYEGKNLIRFKENTINEFILDLIKIRQYLVKNKKGRMEAKLVADLGYLVRHMVAYPNRSETGTAAFFIRHLDKFKNIMPGNGSASYKALSTRFAETEYICRVKLAENAPDYTVLA